MSQSTTKIVNVILVALALTFAVLATKAVADNNWKANIVIGR